MQEKDFLIKKYEYDTISKLELENRLREENVKFQEIKSRIQEKNSDFERVRSSFIERKTKDDKDAKNNLKFLQKRIVEKSKDLEKNKAIASELELKTQDLTKKLNKSNKMLEFIYKKIEDIKLTQKIKKENIETTENIETFIVSKRFKDLFEKDKASLKVKELDGEKEKSFIEEIESDVERSTNLECTSDSLQECDNRSVIVQNNDNSFFDTSFNGEQSKNKNASESFLSFEKFQERIDELSVQKFENGSSISLEYTSEAGNLFNLNFLENQNIVDINISINSYKDYLNFHKERTKILETLKSKGLNVRNIILRQTV